MSKLLNKGNYCTIYGVFVRNSRMNVNEVDTLKLQFRLKIISSSKLDDFNSSVLTKILL